MENRLFLWADEAGLASDKGPKMYWERPIEISDRNYERR